MWTETLNVEEVREIRTRTNIFFGAGAIGKTDVIAADLNSRSISKVLCVTGHGAYKKCGAWDVTLKALKNHSIDITLYDGATPNPTTRQVDEAVAAGLNAGAEAVIAIGGGSAIDVGKSAAILMRYPDRTAQELFEFKFTPQSALDVIAVNLTHGTGTETNRFAVVTIEGTNQKPAIAYDCIYPKWAIDDPKLMCGLSDQQTRFVSIDALNHAIEASTAKSANPLSIMLGCEAAKLIVKYLPDAEKNPYDVRARYFLLYASMIAGMAFDNGLLHFTHALEHPLSGLKPELSHGLGLAMLLPSVVENIYPASGKVLSSLLAPLAPGLTGSPEEAHKAAMALESWLEKNGVGQKLSDEGFAREDIDALVNLAFDTPSLSLLLSVAPTESTRSAVRAIFDESMTPVRDRRMD